MMKAVDFLVLQSLFIEISQLQMLEKEQFKNPSHEGELRGTPGVTDCKYIGIRVYNLRTLIPGSYDVSSEQLIKIELVIA